MKGTLTLLALMTWAAPASADILFDSINGETGSFSTAFGNLDATFTTSSATILGDVALKLDGAGDPGATYTISLVGGIPLSDVSFDPNFGLNVNPFPGPVISADTFSIATLSADPTVEHFDQFAGTALKANSLYWIDITSPNLEVGGGFVDWSTTSDVSGLNVAGNYKSSDATDFTFFRNQGVPPFPGNQAFQMEISTAIPEPSTWAMMLMGLIGLGVLRQRRIRT